MASMCLDYSLSSPVFFEQSDTIDHETLENRTGDTPYITVLYPINDETTHSISHIALMASSGLLILMIGAIVASFGGETMFYIPLYAALMPLIYWVLKIGYAYYVVKRYKLIPSSEFFHRNNDG